VQFVLSAFMKSPTSLATLYRVSYSREADSGPRAPPNDVKVYQFQAKETSSTPQ